jgi:hypothetical protein
MKQFSVFKHPAGELEVVKQGWSWPAFFFTFIWAMAVKMWDVGIAVMVTLFVVSFALLSVSFVLNIPLAGEIAQRGLLIVVSIVLGAKGNSWREINLLSRGFELKDTVTASNKDAALALFHQKTHPSHRSHHN